MHTCHLGEYSKPAEEHKATALCGTRLHWCNPVSRGETIQSHSDSRETQQCSLPSSCGRNMGTDHHWAALQAPCLYESWALWPEVWHTPTRRSYRENCDRQGKYILITNMQLEHISAWCETIWSTVTYIRPWRANGIYFESSVSEQWGSGFILFHSRVYTFGTASIIATVEMLPGKVCSSNKIFCLP